MSTFTLKHYRENEGINYHTENAVKLVNRFGTDEEKRRMSEIAFTHGNQGFLTGQQFHERYQLSNKYWRNLVDEYSEAQKRLEYLRAELRSERISYSELFELQSLKDYIEDDDVELLEAAGVTEKS